MSAACRAPLPGRGEIAAPDAGAGALGCRLGVKVVGGVLAVVERPSLADEPIVDVFAARVAHGQQPAVSIAGVADALDLTSAQVLCQPFRGGPAAGRFLPVGGAGLVQLGRVDALIAFCRTITGDVGCTGRSYWRRRSCDAGR